MLRTLDEVTRSETRESVNVIECAVAERGQEDAGAAAPYKFVRRSIRWNWSGGHNQERGRGAMF